MSAWLNFRQGNCTTLTGPFGGCTFNTISRQFVFALVLWSSLSSATIVCPVARLSDVALELPGQLALVAGTDWRIPRDILAAIREQKPLDGAQVARLKTWARKEIYEEHVRAYVMRATANPSLRKLSLFTSFHGEGMLGHSDQLAMGLTLDDVGFFAPGHGTPGGKEHVLRVFAEGIDGDKQNRFRMEVDAEALQKVYADLPGSRSARIIFYSSCSAGLDGPKGEPANARMMARLSGRPVIAPLGELTGVPTSQGGLKIRVEGRTADDSFVIFQPDGSSRIVSFEKFRSLVFKHHVLDKVNYLEN